MAMAACTAGPLAPRLRRMARRSFHARAGKYLEIQTDNGFAVLECIVAGHWSVMGSFGTIAYEA